MLKTALLLLCSVAILVSGADDAAANGSSTTETTSSKTTVTAKTPTSVPTTLPPTITTPIKPTSKPTTTPEIPTTTPTTTTTPGPTPKPTPGPSPTPVPAPTTGKWIVNGTDQQICIIAQMAIQFNLTYITSENKTDYLVIDLPASNQTEAQGKCGGATDLEQNLTLTWKPTYIYTSPFETGQNNLTLHFVKNVAKNQYALHHLELSLAPEEFPKIRANYSTTFMHQSDLFTTSLKNSYRCLRIQTLNLTDADNMNKTGEFTVSDLQFQAFHAENTSNFGFAEDCAFDTPDIVPIAVGCALALLVVFVLIAYLAARRHSQARGYLSM